MEKAGPALALVCGLFCFFILRARGAGDDTPPPLRTFAFVAMLIIGAINLSAVGLFGEMAFWFALVKFLALVLFLAVDVVFLISGRHVAGAAGLYLLAEAAFIMP